MKKFVSTTNSAQIVSYKVAQLLAKKKKSQAAAVEKNLPALKIAAEHMLTRAPLKSSHKLHYL